MPRLQRRGDLAGGDVQRGEQRRGAVAVVVVRAALDPAFLHRQDRHRAVQRLDLGLLIHAQHDRVLRRGQIQPADVGDLPDQLGVGGEPERLRLPRLDPVGPPRAGDRGVGDLEPIGEQPGRPVRHPELLRRRLQRLGHDRAMIQRPRPTRTRRIAPDRPVPWLVAPAPRSTPWSPSHRPAQRSACSPPRRRPAARSAHAWQPTPAPSKRESTVRAPLDHHHEEPKREQDDSPCPMISDPTLY